MATRKRGQNEGSIYQRKDGRWVGVFSKGDGRRVARYGRTRQEAAQKMVDAQRAHQDGMLPGDGRLTVRRLAGQWLESIKHSVRPSTHRRYEGILRVNVIPGIGKMRLTQLQPAHLENLYAQRLDEGMSPQTVVHVHRVIHAMLEKATRWGIVPRNVASLASPPKVPHREMVVLSVEECQTLLSAAGGTRLEVLWWIAIGTGLRAGEILALRWRDLDFDRARLHVRHTLQRYGRTYSLAEPKTARSRRVIALTTTLSAKLTQHRARQNEERLVAGPMWNDEDFVLSKPDGRPLDVGELGRTYLRAMLRASGISRSLRFHDLRHTAISLALSRGVAPTDVAEMAGHSSVAVTLTRYAHALPDAPKRATDAIDAALAG